MRTRIDELLTLAKEALPYSHQSILDVYVMGALKADTLIEELLSQVKDLKIALNEMVVTQQYNMQLMSENEKLWDKVYQLEEKLKEVENAKL